MRKISIQFLMIVLLVSCSKQDKNILLLKAYSNDDYAKCLDILRDGADGRIDFLEPNHPILFDICRKYLDTEKRSREIEELFVFYLENRKKAFEDSIRGIYPKQTIGSYLARFASDELLKQIAQEKININSSEERDYNTVMFELARIRKGMPIRSDFYDNLAVNENEKKERMELLLEAGADVTLIHDKMKATIFHAFIWYPMEEDYTELLDRMIEKGADLFQKDANGHSCISYKVQFYALESNTEAYLAYVISRGLEVTEEDLDEFYARWARYMRGDKVTGEELRRLEKIEKLLEENVK